MSLEQVDARVLLAFCAALLVVGAWVGRMEAFRKDTKDLLKEIRDDVKNIFRSMPSPAIEKTAHFDLQSLGKSYQMLLTQRSGQSEPRPRLSLK